MELDWTVDASDEPLQLAGSGDPPCVTDYLAQQLRLFRSGDWPILNAVCAASWQNPRYRIQGPYVLEQRAAKPLANASTQSVTAGDWESSTFHREPL